MRLASALPIATLAALVVARPSAAQDLKGLNERSFTVTARVAAGGTVGIFTTRGDVAITEGDGAQVSLKAEKGNDDELGYELIERDGAVVICIMREDDDCSSTGLRSRGREGWRMRNRDRDRVTITVTVPRGIRLRASSGNGRLGVRAAVTDLVASSGNGRIEVAGVEGPVRASSGNGDVSVETARGPVDASSGNGRIRVVMDRLEGSGDITLSTGNGRIELVAPASMGADIDASTGNGAVTTDFPVQLVGRMTPHRLRGTIGDGGRRLRLSSGNGEIEIRKKA